MIEQWREVPEYEGYYQVSNLGRVRSIDRQVRTSRGYRRCRGGLRSLVLNPVNGYLYIGLSQQGITKMKPVHHWVSLAWLGPCPEGQEVRHGPNGKRNNAVTNLSYGTRIENHADKLRDGSSGRLAVRRSDGIVFISMTIAAQVTGCPLSSISQVCKGKLKHAGGYSWEKQ